MEDYDEETILTAPKDLDELVKQLHVAFRGDTVNVDYVKALLSSYRSNPRDWKRFAKFDTHRYTRNLVDIGNGKFNLMALCWGEGHGSSIHDHADSHCFVKVLNGTLRESMFEWPQRSEEETEMTKREVNDYEKDGVAYINDEMGLHRMENPSHTDKCVSLHLYIPPFGSCKTFDEKTGHTNEAKMTFWSKFGKRTPFSSVVDAVHNVIDSSKKEKHPGEYAFANAVKTVVESKRRLTKDEREQSMEIAQPENN